MNMNELFCSKWCRKTCAVVLTGTLLCSLYSVFSSQALARDSEQAPLYSRYYDAVLKLEKSGDFEAALAAIPKVYEAEFPVDTFHQTLDRKKRSLLQALIDSPESKEQIETSNLYYRALLLKADVLQSVYTTARDLPPERFFYLQAILNNSKEDLKKAAFIESADAWLVASSLFMARKTTSSLSPEDVVKQWQKNVHLWDDVCVEQALLYLAKQSSTGLKKIIIENEDIRDKINQLKDPQVGKGEVQILTFTWDFRKPDLNIGTDNAPLKLTLKTLNADNETISEKKLEKQVKTLVLPPGKYSFSHVEGSTGSGGEYTGTHGKSAAFEVTEKTFIRIFMEIIAGI